MKKLLITIFVLFSSANLFSQDTHWSTISMLYSNGPVSPENQYHYQIFLDEFGEGVLNYKDANGKKEKNFTVSRENLEEFNEFFKASEVFTISPSEMKSETNTVGGPVRSLEVLMWQAPNLDAMPTTIIIPEHINKKYSEKMKTVYEKIEALVPEEIFSDFKIQK